MGNPNSKEKQKFIEEQKKIPSQGMPKSGAVVMDDRIDSPHFEVLAEFPTYLQFFCPSAVTNTQVHAALKDFLMRSATNSRLNFAMLPINPVELSVLLPLYIKNCPNLEEISLRGVVGVDMGLLTAMLRHASINLRVIDLEDTHLEGYPVIVLLRGLKQFAEDTQRNNTSRTIEVLAENGNAFFCRSIDMSVKHNERLASEVEALESQYGIIVRHPKIPETPFEVNGKWVTISEVDEYTPIASTYVQRTSCNFMDVDDGEAKADFLVSTVSAIMRAQRDPRRMEGLRYIPRLFHLQKYTRVFLTLVSENVGRQQSFVQIGQLFSQATADQWTIMWRMEIVLQVAHVCTFMHSLNAGLREIFPTEILVDMQQKRIMYTQLSSLRPQGMGTRLHREVAGDRLRFADPAENNRTDFTLPKDLYALAKLLIFFLVPLDNQKQFSTLFQPPLNITQDLSIPTQYYVKLLDERLPPDTLLDAESKLHIAGLVAECTMKDEMRRPTAQAFSSRLAAIIKGCSK